MTNEFRDLERPQALRRKDVVLMATVTSFEELSHPSKTELRQFAELFMPVFNASTDDARRQAVAALSQSKNVPPAVAFFIGCQPIAIAAPFLMASTCLTDEALITIARSQGAEHARAIVRRDALSPTVIDALVGLRPGASRQAKVSAPTEVRTQGQIQGQIQEMAKVAAEPASAHLAPPLAPSLGTPISGQLANPLSAPSATPSTAAFAAPLAPANGADAERMAREEDLRRRIKLLAGHMNRSDSDRLGLRSLTPVQEALIVRFARNREAMLFVTVLSDILSSSRWLAERILLDLSGVQLATVLKGLGMGEDDAAYILTRLYGHLAEEEDGVAKVADLWDTLDGDECGQRIEAWRRADRYTHAVPREEAQDAYDAAILAEDRPLRTSASVRRSVSGARGR